MKQIWLVLTLAVLLALPMVMQLAKH